jgi:hypothetical protein
MRAHTATPVPPVAQLLGQPERRHGNRTPAFFSLLYSGMSTGEMLIGDGVVTNLSLGGIGIRGKRSVIPGMDMARFVDLPRVEEPLCIAQSQVCWVAGLRFGVALGSLTLEEKKHLQFFSGGRMTPPDRDGGAGDHSRNKEVLL